LSQLRHRLDLQLFAGEKTEKATPKKRQDARKKGQVASSPEISSSLILLGAIGSFLMLGPLFQERLLALFGDVFLHRLSMDVTDQNVMVMFYRYIVQILLLLAPILILVVVITFAASYAQFGWLFTLEPLKPDLKRLDPIKGVKRLFSLRAIVDFLKSSLKLIVISAIVFSMMWSNKKEFLKLAYMPITDMLAFCIDLAIKTGLLVAATLFVLSIGDFMFAKYEHEKNLRMSKQDIKDEHKNMEGDPKVKARIRERQRRMALMRMMQEVPKADVVITNPTHYAVALQYDGTRMEAPVVIAKGQDYIALRIKEVARQHQIVTMENKPLARALYERSEIGEMIPADLFQAVAEVLAYVYRLKGRRNA